MLHERPLFAHTTFITAGSEHTGYQAAELLALQNSQLIIGSRNLKKIQRSSEHIASIDGVWRVTPFSGDLSDTALVTRMMSELAPQLQNTDVIYSAAAGMENFGTPLLREFVGLRGKKRKGDITAETAALKEQIETWVDESIERGDCNVNYEGAVHFITEFMKYKDPSNPTWFVYMSSLPSTFYPEMFESWDSNPNYGFKFYRGVAQSKHNFEGWLKLNAPELMEHGIYPAVATAHLLKDTGISLFAKAMAPFVEDPAQTIDLESCPKMIDLARTSVDILSQRPSVDASPTWPMYRFVMNHGLVVPEISFEEFGGMRLPF